MQSFAGDIFMIGAGSMAEAFIRGVTERKAVDAAQIRVINRSHPHRVGDLQRTYGIRPAESWADIASAKLVVVAVKPSDVAAALTTAKPYLDGQWVLSFAAGVPLALLQDLVGDRANVVRTMPNIPVAVLAGATAVSFGPGFDAASRAELMFLLEQVGEVVEIPE
ncbi:MAG: NAD(P)-binding domain-containing protein, partial [Alicyclobacillus sp.]|nr:NAD(P)-binding domain-containing protein [Alicyclobacillus sp.]